MEKLKKIFTNYLLAKLKQTHEEGGDYFEIKYPKLKNLTILEHLQSQEICDKMLKEFSKKYVLKKEYGDNLKYIYAIDAMKIEDGYKLFIRYEPVV